MWIVGSILCDVIIAVCMTYYVGLPTFLPLFLENYQISFLASYGSSRDMILPSNKPKLF